MSADQPRDVNAIDQAIAAVRSRQRAKFAQRDRAERAMLAALHDAEMYERQAADEDAHIEKLFDERERATHPERFAPDTRIGSSR